MGGGGSSAASVSGVKLSTMSVSCTWAVKFVANGDGESFAKIRENGERNIYG
jgi:hypothetical protein